MLYITQLIFIKEGRETIFHEFEDNVLPLLDNFNAKLVYRIRPEREQFISASEELPYEIHVVTFPTENVFERYMKDTTRLRFLPLKEDAVKRIVLLKGFQL
jgi:hypothetical protein